MKTLSDKIMNVWVSNYDTADVISKIAVKEFIKNIREEMKDPKINRCSTDEIIDYYAGDGLLGVRE